MGVKLTTKEFIRRAVNTHGDAYDYSLSEYTGAQEEVNIFCKRHEKHFLQRANDHTKGSNCPTCAKENEIIVKRFTTEEFIERSKEINGDLYGYDKSEYINSRTKVEIFCKVHNRYFFKTPDKHWSGYGCRECNKKTGKPIKTTQQFIKEAKELHGDKYDYSLVEYTNARVQVKITCNIHEHTFFQKPVNHLQNKGGCPICASMAVGMGFSRSEYIKQAADRICIFYTIRCFNEAEEFYKIGITMNNVKNRYSGSKTMPYEYEVISEIKGSAGFIWDLERDEKRKLKSLHYKPNLNFGGSETECFTDYKI